MKNKQDKLIRQWAKAGVLFNTNPARKSPDLERLLLDTARQAPSNARLFIMATTWLSKYSALIAKHRLRRLIQEELEEEHRPTMGLMLKMAIDAGANEGLNKALEACSPAKEPKPLFESMRRNLKLCKLAEKRATDTSKYWGRWTQTIDLKLDALRPTAWLVRHNPDFANRAAHKGDLRTTIIETLRRDLDTETGISESRLTRYCSANRGGVRSALDSLELEGLISLKKSGNEKHIQLAQV